MAKVTNKKLAISNCLKNLSPMREIAKERLDSFNEQIASLTSEQISKEDLAKLNSAIASRNGAMMFMLWEQELQEDLDAGREPAEENTDKFALPEER